MKINSEALIDKAVYVLIVLSIAGIIIETHNISDGLRDFLQWFEIITYLAFSLEYVYRIRQASKLSGWPSYIFSFIGMIDLLAILPFYLPFIIAIDSRAIRLLRLLRLVNVLKMGKHSSAINILLRVVKSVKTEVVITLFASIVIIVFAGIIMFYAEKDAQPDIFYNMSQSIWWALTTLTTIGYGDIYPITPLGKLVASILAYIGIGLVAVPTGLISAAYINEVNSKKK